MSKKYGLISVSICLTLFATACNLFFLPPSPIALEISGFTETSTICAEGIQATLVILKDGTTIASPIMKPGEQFREASEKSYANTNDRRISLEVFCYEANDVTGRIVVEGLALPGQNNGDPIYLDIYRSEGEYCLSRESIANQPADAKRDVKIISLQEPVPCISFSDFNY